jgi:hypothetical protein
LNVDLESMNGDLLGGLRHLDSDGLLASEGKGVEVSVERDIIPAGSHASGK